MKRAALVLALALTNCTIGGALTGVAITGGHNVYVDHKADEWGYAVPILIGAGVGLILDIIIVKALTREWSRPWT